jgi:hypothetical protein
MLMICLVDDLGPASRREEDPIKDEGLYSVKRKSSI